MAQTGDKGSLNPTVPQRDALKEATGRLDNKMICAHLPFYPTPPPNKKFPSSSPPQFSFSHLQSGEMPGSTRIVNACF